MIQEQTEAQAYWDANPNAIHSGHTFAPGSAYFAEWAMEHRYSTEPSIDYFARFDMHKDDDVLDLGCGLGFDTIRFARTAKSVTGVDFSAQSLELAEMHAKALAVNMKYQEHPTFVLAGADSLPFDDDSFDYIWCHGVIHHMEDPTLAVREIHRVLRKGGTAHVMVYHRNSWFAKGLIPRVVAPIVRTSLALRHTPAWPAVRRALPYRVRQLVEIMARDGYDAERLLTLSTDWSTTDESGVNPISRFYSKADAIEMFRWYDFDYVAADVRTLYHFPPVPSELRTYLERKYGGFVYVTAMKEWGEFLGRPS